MTPAEKVEIIKRLAWHTYTRCTAEKYCSDHVKYRATRFFMTIWLSIDENTLDTFLLDLKRRGYTIPG
jgi:hypothetical protein